MVQRMRKTPLSAAERRGNVIAIPRARTGITVAPDHLAAEEKQLWAALCETYVLDDPASLTLLTTALECRGRARKCREQIDREGETFRDRFGQLRPSPLLAAERAAAALFLSAMKALRLDTAGVL